MPDITQSSHQNNIAATEQDHAPIQIGDPDPALQSLSFAPFEKEIQCPHCEHRLLMWLQPQHNSMDLACPSCLHALGYVLRREIREHLAQP